MRNTIASCTHDEPGAYLVHTNLGLACSECHKVVTGWEPVVPFGITRQLEELDRMMTL
jgi:hypothetical protein